MIPFNSPQELELFLHSKNIDTTSWGSGAAKSIEDLWTEIRNGETYIQESPLKRVVEIVQVIIKRDNKILIETEQEFRDGHKRRRNAPPSEKIKLNQSVIETAKNCLSDELGLSPSDYSIIVKKRKPSSKSNNSPSYPGLKSKYIIHYVEAKAQGLPINDFWTDEADGNIDDPIRRHYWSWIDETLK